MPLKNAPQVVNGIRTLYRDGHFGRRKYVSTTTIPALLSAWYDVDLPNGALRETLAAAGIEPANGRYDLYKIVAELAAEDGRLWQVATRAEAQMAVEEVRVSLADPDSETPGQVSLTVDVPALATRQVVPCDDDHALAQAVRQALGL